jgi:signal recognition particle subunit SRP54
MFDQISERLGAMMRFLKGEGKVTEKNMAEALKMMRLALLEADVNYRVVKEFEEKVRTQSLGEDVLRSLTPAHQVIRIVRDELAVVLGGTEKPLLFASRPPSVFMIVGLQGSGKTTTCGKLARFTSKKMSKNPLLVSTDFKRPAAQDQLRTIAEGLGLPFYEMPRESGESPEKLLDGCLRYASNRSFDPLIVDTAGRLHVDADLMDELRRVKTALRPSEVVFVGDALTGQDAVKSARAFDETIGLTSIILTKLDGDARGGAAMSIASVTGKPIKFCGVGEKPDQLEVFHPERMAARILGMGDILGLIEKAEEQADLQASEDALQKIRRREFTLDDFRSQIVQIRKMGSLSQILGFLPKSGLFKEAASLPDDDRKILHFEAIINSMTPEERRNPRILNGRRRSRIARGSGRPVHEVNQLLKHFADMQKMIREPRFRKLMSRFG